MRRTGLQMVAGSGNTASQRRHLVVNGHQGSKEQKLTVPSRVCNKLCQQTSTTLASMSRTSSITSPSRFYASDLSSHSWFVSLLTSPLMFYCFKWVLPLRAALLLFDGRFPRNQMWSFMFSSEQGESESERMSWVGGKAKDMLSVPGLVLVIISYRDYVNIHIFPIWWCNNVQ